MYAVSTILNVDSTMSEEVNLEQQLINRWDY